jgi:formylglycine-generating enzyme required for sulfatase activity
MSQRRFQTPPKAAITTVQRHQVSTHFSLQPELTMVDKRYMNRSWTTMGLLLLILIFLWAPSGSCSGISVTNISLGSRNASTGDSPVNFDISWNNSWRSTDPGAPAPNNWDAAWVFVKFQKNGGDWQHASLNDTGHTVPSGASLDVGLVDTSASFNIATNPGVGVFIYRSADGVGTFSKAGFSLNWHYVQDGVDEDDSIVLRVFAIEMVYVPNGAFFAGDNASSGSSLIQGSSDNDPWYIDSENEITTANAPGSGTGAAETAAEYYYVTDNFSYDEATGAAFTIPSTFPKGFGKFYVMKGEISQGQWLAFFNSLTTTQKSARDITSASGKNSDSLSFRNNISWSSGDAILPDQGGGATYEYVPMNYLSWVDIAAYLDWAGLRPMTELEFERAARGPYRAVSGEFAWGGTFASVQTATGITNGGTASEGASSAANLVFSNGVSGPLRVGAMAKGDSTRVASGAGYYGCVDLSGNLSEHTVTIGNSSGRSFDKRYHGNGLLTSGGAPNVSTWPTGAGVGSRGGDFASSSQYSRISTRHFAASGTGATQNVRFNTSGGRGVRTAP